MYSSEKSPKKHGLNPYDSTQSFSLSYFYTLIVRRTYIKATANCRYYSGNSFHLFVGYGANIIIRGKKPNVKRTKMACGQSHSFSTHYFHDLPSNYQLV